jgi:uncharacterized surface protein with fasciclin (FAS1) repeats
MAARREKQMTLRKASLLVTVAICALPLGACATMTDDKTNMQSEQTVMVGGAAMYASRNIVENAVNSRDHTTLVAAVKAAGLVETLSGAGPFTVFAPTNAAFASLPAGTVDTLLKPENKAMLQSILTYHVVPGRLTAADLLGQIRAGGGTAQLRTVQGGILTARMQGDAMVLIDAKGGTATVTQTDVLQSNGVIHVTNSVSLPS